ncbi:DUF4136 domain-containing protein [Spongiibacter sp. KMU-158]|uniref:DUF4136 domain-containing protein n=1 Tax=Spongiibacter pelagi TaxID=2760804 RepID=A0A927C2M4_9GAMM|nr:DUF4136 domain-containing protein [Spongiibacter pelagi]MBD2858506.1 DUF4136 domain-containing protein [Spongiibacter pelagi]
MRFLLAGFILLLSACGTLPVSTDFKPGYDFAGVGSYVWLAPAPQASATQNIELQSDLSHQRIVDAIDAQLQARGWKKLDAPTADSVLVTYHRGIEEQREDRWAYGIDSHWAYPHSCYSCYRHPAHFPYYGSRFDYYDQRSYNEDSLVIDFVEPEAKALVWRGSSQRRLLSMGSPEERAIYIQETVAAILQNFPPGVVQK